MIGAHFIDQIAQLSSRTISVAKTKLDQKIDNLTDLIKVRIVRASMYELADSLRDQMIELRFHVIKELAETSTIKYASGINDYIAENIQLSAYSELAETTAEVLMAQEKIFDAVFNTMGLENFSQMIDYDLGEIKNKFPGFDKSAIAIRKWLDKSIDVELSLLIAQMVLSNEIQLKKGKQKELMSFMINSVSSYGGHAIYLGIWEPSENDDSRMSRNMEMLASMYGVDYGRGYRLNQEGQKIMIEA